MTAGGSGKHRLPSVAGGVRRRRERSGRRHGTAFLLRVVGALALAAAAAVPGPARAQESPDTIPADTLPADTVSPDTLPDAQGPLPAPDSVAVDSLAAADTTVADTIRLEHLPRPAELEPGGWETGVWSWSREEMLASRAATLSELLGQVPGVLELRGGDFGMPHSATAFGAGGGGIRVYRDGVEVLPLEGSVVDLARVGLAGAEEVRVRRTGSGIRIDLRSLRAEDPRPYSLVEAGTGDLDTNLLRGVFFHPRTLGGNAGLSLERRDTRGPRRQEPGAVTSFWLHYAYLAGESFGVAADLSRSTANRDTLFVPGQVTRTDWRLRGRWRPLEEVVADLFYVRSTLAADSTSGAVESFPFRSEARSQWGARLSAGKGPVAARLAYRNPVGEGLARRHASGELLGRVPGVGGAAGSWRWSEWDARGTTSLGVRAWTEPVWGLSAFGAWEDFEGGVPALPPAPAPEDDAGGDAAAAVPFRGTTAAPRATVGGSAALLQEGGDSLSAEPRFSEGRFFRVGGRFAWRGLELSGARLELERDSVHPLGLPMDRAGTSLAGGERSGWEAAFRVPLLLLDGLALEGSGQLWERSEEPWPYFPRRSWQGALSLHDTYLPSGNLEIWLDVGVRQRDAMTVPLQASPEADGDGGSGGDGTSAVAGAIPAYGGASWGPAGSAGSASALLQDFEAAEVPFYRSFYARLQIRVVSVRVFIRWENFLMREINQDFPERVLPRTRALYGVRWTLWN